jgi:hypothetical protein
MAGVAGRPVPAPRGTVHSARSPLIVAMDAVALIVALRGPMGWLSLVVLLGALSDIACCVDGHAVSRVAQLAGQACSQLLLGVCGKGRYQRAKGCS